MSEDLKGWAPAPGLVAVEFTEWVSCRTEIRCEAIGHNAALTIRPALTRNKRFDWVATSLDGAVLAEGQDRFVEEAMVSAKKRTREVLGKGTAVRDDYTRLPDGKQRWTSRCGRACIDVWFDGTEWCYVAKAPGAATSNGMVTRCGSEHAAKMGGSTAAAVMLDRLDAEPPFAKSDATKPRAELLPPRALLAVSRVLTHGAAKYGHENHLRAGDDVENRYMGATLRHLLAHMSGEAADAETGESHLAHAAADLLLMLERGAAAKE